MASRNRIPQGGCHRFRIIRLSGENKVLKAALFSSVGESESVGHSVGSDSLRPHGLQPTRLLCPWDSPGKSTGVGYRSLLEGTISTWGSNLGLLPCTRILSHLIHEESPVYSKGIYKHSSIYFQINPDTRRIRTINAGSAFIKFLFTLTYDQVFFISRTLRSLMMSLSEDSNLLSLHCVHGNPLPYSCLCNP